MLINTPAELAAHLQQLHAERAPFQTLQLAGRPLDMAQAYRVQDALVDAMCRGGDRVAGYKIGLTSPAMQQMCGIASPVHGRILASRVYQSGQALPLAQYVRLGLEFEIVVRLGRDVRDPPATAEALGPWVDAIAPAFELIEDRDADYAILDAASLVADNAWSAGLVHGTWQTPPTDLPARTGRIHVDGVLHEEGRVGDAFGHPFASVLWLAQALVERGHYLRAGDLLMTGSIVRTQFPKAPGPWRYAVDGLGDVRLELR